MRDLLASEEVSIFVLLALVSGETVEADIDEERRGEVSGAMEMSDGLCYGPLLLERQRVCVLDLGGSC